MLQDIEICGNTYCVYKMYLVVRPGGKPIGAKYMETSTDLGHFEGQITQYIICLTLNITYSDSECTYLDSLTLKTYI